MTARVDLYWIPLGAGAHVVRVSGAIYEALHAVVHRHPRRALFHSALEIEVDRMRTVVEVTPIPRAGDHHRGVVGEGPVGLASLGRFRLFRYEIRRWEGGAIPDVGFAVGGPVGVASDPEVARAVLAALEFAPRAVWGRDELATGDMWNSNSVVSFALAKAGLDARGLGPPDGGRAPGWDAGVIVAGRG